MKIIFENNDANGSYCDSDYPINQTEGEAEDNWDASSELINEELAKAVEIHDATTRMGNEVKAQVQAKWSNAEETKQMLQANLFHDQTLSLPQINQLSHFPLQVPHHQKNFITKCLPSSPSSPPVALLQNQPISFAPPSEPPVTPVNTRTQSSILQPLQGFHCHYLSSHPRQGSLQMSKNSVSLLSAHSTQKQKRKNQKKWNKKEEIQKMKIPKIKKQRKKRRKKYKLWAVTFCHKA